MTMTLTKKPARKTLTLTSKAKMPKLKKTAQGAAPASESAPLAIATPAPATPASEPAAPAPAKPKAKAAAPKAKPTKAPGKSVAIYAAALAHPDKSGKEFADLVIASGVKSSEMTVLTIRSDFVRACNFLSEQGLMKSPFSKVA
jgi:hypothetical protein